MGDDIEINVTETTNIIEITPQLNDQIIDIAVTDNAPNVEINVTPSVIEINVTRGSSTAIWGGITGNLTDQTDLQGTLDLKANLVGGKVPASELPSYVDDIIEVANYAALPTTGETGKIYVTLNNNKIYRWSGSIYIEIAANNAVWGSITGTLGFQMDLQSALNAKFDDPTGDTTQYIAGDGSLITFPVAGQSGSLVREVRNTTGSTLTKGTIVYISGANGNKPTISKAIATGDSTSAQTFGMLQVDLSNNSNGYVICIGNLGGLDTSAITEGTQLYLSSTTAGAYTTTKQIAPAHLVYIGVVTRSHPTQGQIEVKIQNGYELDEIHDVLITSKTNNDILTYESSSSLWKNKSLSTILGYTPSNDSNVVHITGSETITGLKKFTDFLSTDKAYNQKIISGGYMPDAGYANIQQNDRQITFAQFNAAATAVTQFSFIYPDSNTTQFYYVPNASGTLALTSQLHNAVTLGTANGLTLSGQALSLTLASSSANGAISSTDWSTFNNKENAIAAGSTLQYYRGDKNWVTLNTSVVPELTNLYYTEARVNANTNVAANTAARHNAVTIGTANGLSLSTQALSLALASTSTTGALSSTDWNTFNGKQNALTNPITGTGTTNYLPKFTGLTALGNSLIYDNGTNVGIGTTSPSSLLTLQSSSSGSAPIYLALNNIAGGIGVGGGLQIQSGGTSIASLDWLYDGSVFNSSLSSFGNLLFKTNGSTERMRITSGGNVGIGTTAFNLSASGRQMLSLSGATSTIIEMQSGGTNQSYIYTGNAGNMEIYGYQNIAFATNGGTRMSISSTGVVSVNNLGTGLVYSNGGALTSTNPSDSRLKDDITDLQYGLNEILKLRPVTYNWKDDKINQGKQFGFIAQEVQEVMPELVKEFETEEGERLGLDKEGIYAALVNAIQELKAEIEILKTK